MNPESLVFGKYNIKEIKKATSDTKWQRMRVSLKGQPLQVRYRMLSDWLVKNKNSRKSRIQVTNYINALKRAGMI